MLATLLAKLVVVCPANSVGYFQQLSVCLANSVGYFQQLSVCLANSVGYFQQLSFVWRIVLATSSNCRLSGE